MDVIYKQIQSIKDRFMTNNKQRTFRFVVLEFANAPQRLGTYYIDDFVENIDAISFRHDYSNSTIGGTSLKKMLNEVDNCIEHHITTHVKSKEHRKPPVSVIVFSGSTHGSTADYSFGPFRGSAPRETEFSKNSVQHYVEQILCRDHVFLGIFDFVQQNTIGERIEDATVITEELIKSAIQAERRYGVLPGDSISDYWDDPMSLVGQKFIFPATDFTSEGLSKFLAVMLKLGTYTSTSADGEDDDDDWF